MALCSPEQGSTQLSGRGGESLLPGQQWEVRCVSIALAADPRELGRLRGCRATRLRLQRWELMGLARSAASPSSSEYIERGPR